MANQILQGLDEMVPNNITGASSDSEIITELLKDNLYNKVIQQYYDIMKNVEYRSVGKHSYYCLRPNYATSGTSNINCNLSLQYMSYLANYNTLFGRVLQLAIMLVSENKRRHNQKALGIPNPVCGILSKKC